MHANNPEHNPSHEVEDWVIENFTDRCLALGFKGSIHKAVSWWWDQNEKEWFAPHREHNPMGVEKLVKDIKEEISMFQAESDLEWENIEKGLEHILEELKRHRNAEKAS